ncbi:signal peptidase I [Pseudarthrobacter siccitolerans]|uniref:Signal peptidase I n=1 Tax=Pseudarthrobacter siccitolerans TaxID=861266 RepID=A0ABU0PID1_9MICC|nr:signal peptidase I [Pseudarthrobacter siccitolerans]MDQ0673706.1 signal peptidase I [Pseudarthrobacter siccitolerans]
MMRRLSRLQNNVLTLGAVLGALCLVVAIAAVLTGAKPLVFRSGSMAPSIPTGALGISIPVEAKSISIGDVISVENAAGVRITHRVVQADIAGETATVKLKGDANSVADAAPYVLHETDRVVAHFPFLGYAVAWLSSSAAVFAGGLLTAYLLYVAFGSSRRRGCSSRTSQVGVSPLIGHRVAERRSLRTRRAQRHGRRATRLTAMALACVGVLTGGAIHTAAPSQAAFTDNATGAVQYNARSLAAPTFACKQAIDAFLFVNLGKIDLSWNDNNGSLEATGYRLSTQIGNSTATEESVTAATRTRTVAASDINSSVATTVTFTLHSYYQNWESAATVAADYRPAGFLTAATLQCSAG